MVVGSVVKPLHRIGFGHEVVVRMQMGAHMPCTNLNVSDELLENNLLLECGILSI